MSYRRHLTYFLTSALCLVSATHANAETLREAVTSALASHPGIEVAQARKDVASAEESEQFSNLFPEINTSATGGRVFGNNATSRGLNVSRGEAYSWLWEGNASITQPIFNGFATYNRIDAAQAREEAAEFTLADAKQGLALRAAQAFLNVKRAQEAYAKTTSYQDRIKDYLSRINGMVDAGAADESEAAQAKNIQSQLENSVAEMEGQVKLALADYAEVTGSMPTGELNVAMDASDMLYPTADEAVSQAVEQHPLILSAAKTLEAEDEEVSAESVTLMPTLDAEASALKRDQKEEIGGEVVDQRAIMRMNWSFSTGGGQLARIKKQKAERSEALARNAQAQREIERDIRKAYAEHETAMKQKELSAKRATVTKELFQTYEKQFEASKVRLLQLMQAENQVFTSELEGINASYRVMMSEYTTLASSGRLLQAIGIAEGEAVQPVATESSASASVPAAEKMEMVEPVYPKEDYPSAKEDSIEQAVVPAVYPKPAAALTPAPAPAPVVQTSSVYPAEDYKESAAAIPDPDKPKAKSFAAPAMGE